jgi:hypothetical protein
MKPPQQQQRKRPSMLLLLEQRRRCSTSNSRGLQWRLQQLTLLSALLLCPQQLHDWRRNCMLLLVWPYLALQVHEQPHCMSSSNARQHRLGWQRQALLCPH